MKNEIEREKRRYAETLRMIDDMCLEWAIDRRLHDRDEAEAWVAAGWTVDAWSESPTGFTCDAHVSRARAEAA